MNNILSYDTVTININIIKMHFQERCLILLNEGFQQWNSHPWPLCLDCCSFTWRWERSTLDPIEKSAFIIFYRLGCQWSANKGLRKIIKFVGREGNYQSGRFYMCKASLTLWEGLIWQCKLDGLVDASVEGMISKTYICNDVALYFTREKSI